MNYTKAAVNAAEVAIPTYYAYKYNPWIGAGVGVVLGIAFLLTAMPMYDGCNKHGSFEYYLHDVILMRTPGSC